jgi:hypothetical protein
MEIPLEMGPPPRPPICARCWIRARQDGDRCPFAKSDTNQRH